MLSVKVGSHPVHVYLKRTESRATGLGQKELEAFSSLIQQTSSVLIWYESVLLASQAKPQVVSVGCNVPGSHAILLYRPQGVHPKIFGKMSVKISSHPGHGRSRTVESRATGLDCRSVKMFQPLIQGASSVYCCMHNFNQRVFVP